MRAAATMTRDVIAVPPELPLITAWSLLGRWRIRHLPVVQGGKLVGILSDRDILLRAAPGDGDIVVGDDIVGEAMTVAPVSCTRDTPIGWIAKQMIELKIDAVPVTDAVGRLVGLVTSTDLLELLIDRDEAKVIPFDFQVKTANRAGDVAAA